MLRLIILLQMEGSSLPRLEQVCGYHFSISICSLCVSVSVLVILMGFQALHQQKYFKLKAQMMIIFKH